MDNATLTSILAFLFINTLEDTLDANYSENWLRGC